MTTKTDKKIKYPIFAQTFTNWMAKRNYTQQKLGKRLGVAQSVISRFCCGDRLPSLPVFLRLIGILTRSERSQFIKILNQQMESPTCAQYLKQQ
jgi:transcriptional regulator with XRE-family HTH domain